MYSDLGGDCSGTASPGSRYWLCSRLKSYPVPTVSWKALRLLHREIQAGQIGVAGVIKLERRVAVRTQVGISGSEGGLAADPQPIAGAPVQHILGGVVAVKALLKRAAVVESAAPGDFLVVVPKSKLNRARWELVSDDGSLKSPRDRSRCVVFGRNRPQKATPQGIGGQPKLRQPLQAAEELRPCRCCASCVYLVASTSKSTSFPADCVVQIGVQLLPIAAAVPSKRRRRELRKNQSGFRADEWLVGLIGIV